MVFPGEHCRITTPIRVRNMRGRTEQGALLHSLAIRLGRHSVCIYTTKSRCAVYGELQRKMQPCVRPIKEDGPYPVPNFRIKPGGTNVIE